MDRPACFAIVVPVGKQAIKCSLTGLFLCDGVNWLIGSVGLWNMKNY